MPEDPSHPLLFMAREIAADPHCYSQAGAVLNTPPIERGMKSFSQVLLEFAFGYPLIRCAGQITVMVNHHGSEPAAFLQCHTLLEDPHRARAEDNCTSVLCTC